jgi:hypothetical protein
MNNKRLQCGVEQLERKAGIGVTPPPSLVIKFVRPNGHFGGEPCYSGRAEANGRVWHIQQDETQDQFEQRVLAKSRERHETPTLTIFFPEE